MKRKNAGLLTGLGLVLLFYAVLHIFTRKYLLDDIYLGEFYGAGRLSEALLLRYESWTGRIIIEFVYALLMKCPFLLWQLLDTAMYGIIYICLWKLLHIEDRNCILLAMAVCSYIFLQMASAGWVITSVIYVGTMATALVCGVILQAGIRGRRTAVWEYVVYVLCMVYTCNYEIMAVTMLLGSILLIFHMRRRRSGRALYLTGLVLQTASVVYMCLVPGNHVRLQQSNMSYAALNVLDRTRLGVVSTFQHFVSIPNALFAAFCLVLALSAWEKRSSVKDRIIACVPFVTDAFLTVYYFISDILLGGKRNYVFDNAELIPSSHREWAEQLFLVCCCLVVVCAAIYTLWRLTGVNGEFCLLVSLLALGAASRMAMAFTSSLFESGTRTFLEIYFVLAGVTGAMLTYIDNRLSRRLITALLATGMGINLVLTVIPFLQNYS